MQLRFLIFMCSVHAASPVLQPFTRLKDICGVTELQSHLPSCHPLCLPNVMDLESQLTAKPNTNNNTAEGARKGVSTPVPKIEHKRVWWWDEDIGSFSCLSMPWQPQTHRGLPLFRLQIRFQRCTACFYFWVSPLQKACGTDGQKKCVNHNVFSTTLLTFPSRVIFFNRYLDSASTDIYSETHIQ